MANLKRLSPANLEIMKIVWEKGETTVNEVFEIINSKRKEKLRNTTILVQMTRLEEYGWLKHRKVGRTYYYTAVVDQQKAKKSIVSDIKERVFAGSHTEMVKYLFDDENLSPGDVKKLRDLLKKYNKNNKG